jgi:hypothetical protein
MARYERKRGHDVDSLFGGVGEEEEERVAITSATHPSYLTVTTPINVPASDDVIITAVQMTPPRAAPSSLVMWALCVSTVLSNVLMSVTLPIFAGTMNVVGGDTFVVLLYSAIWFPPVLALLAMGLKVRKSRTTI